MAERSEVVKLLLSEAEAADLSRLAAKDGQTRQGYLRALVAKRAKRAPERAPRASAAGRGIHKVRLSDSEKQILMARAKRAGLGFSEYVRARCVYSEPMWVEVDRALLLSLYQELCRQGNNLNQLARRLNAIGEKRAREDAEILSHALGAALDNHARALADIRSLLFEGPSARSASGGGK